MSSYSGASRPMPAPGMPLTAPLPVPLPQVGAYPGLDKDWSATVFSNIPGPL